jgi:hypothetical protein
MRAAHRALVRRLVAALLLGCALVLAACGAQVQTETGGYGAYYRPLGRSGPG